MSVSNFYCQMKNESQLCSFVEEFFETFANKRVTFRIYVSKWGMFLIYQYHFS